MFCPFQDIVSKISSLSQKGPRAVCILSATGLVSSVIIRKPGSSGGISRYEACPHSFLLPFYHSVFTPFFRFCCTCQMARFVVFHGFMKISYLSCSTTSIEEGRKITKDTNCLRPKNQL